MAASGASSRSLAVAIIALTSTLSCQDTLLPFPRSPVASLPESSPAESSATAATATAASMSSSISKDLLRSLGVNAEPNDRSLRVFRIASFIHQVRIVPFPFTSIPSSPFSNRSSTSNLYFLDSSNISTVFLLHWIFMDLLVDSMRAATFTLSPKMVYLGKAAPTTPETMGPVDIPARRNTRISLYRKRVTNSMASSAKSATRSAPSPPPTLPLPPITM
mmetsp:Transcript_18333/g.52478  ORF Transcript_18333/g.52478 Transcript_18333/m.52478 type:complete len:219 (-) Transcript_18333:344-1000(-)